MATKTTKNYVLDTNVVLSDPCAIYAFAEHNVIIPIPVLQEVESFKKGQAERNHQARAFLRELKKFEENFPTLPSEGFPIPEGGRLKFPSALPQKNRLEKYPQDTVDHQLLDLVLSLITKNKNDEFVLVTYDLSLRIKAKTLGIVSEPYKNVQVDTEKIYGEILEVGISGEEEASFHQDKKGFCEKFLSNNPFLEELPLNTPVRLLYQSQNSDDTHEILCLKTANGLEKIRKNDEVFSIKARNVEQQFALHALLDPEIPIVALTGVAGTGKTLLALAAVLKMLKPGQYENAKLARPMVELSDKTMGFLPGTVEEKIDPYFGPIYDNLEFLKSLKPEKKGKPTEGTESNESASQRALKGWMKEQNLECFALNFLRGRSLPKSLIIIDEAQNTTPQEMKTILTRLGEGSKIIVIGDISQIDNPYLGERSNGLAHLIDAFKGREEFFHIHLTKGERSKIATLAAELL
jgi:nucleotide binding protein, PINc